MKWILICSICLFFVALLFDIVFMSTHIIVFKVIHWVALVLACSGSIFYSVKRLRK